MARPIYLVPAPNELAERAAAVVEAAGWFRGGMGASAERVADALGDVDPRARATLDADVSVALAKSGLADDARDRIAANLIRWPHDLWVRVHAGDALVALGDPQGASEHFEAALRMAEGSDDFEATAEVIHRLRKAHRRSAGEHSGPGRQREQPKRKLGKAQRLRRQGRRKPR